MLEQKTKEGGSKVAAQNPIKEIRLHKKERRNEIHDTQALEA
jgi:hypothetical protein